MSKKLSNGVDIATLSALLAFSHRYQISIQFWPKSTAVFIAKNDIDLADFGGYGNIPISDALAYLERINRNTKQSL